MEKTSYKIVYESGEGEIVEKKSRFIAHVYPIKEEEQALELIAQCKKEYWDARHNCYAYVLGAKQELQRFSDDGEPSGTAGKPILEVLLGEDIHNVLVIVTRYFGGTLLGTGGLVRAYSQSTKEGLANSVITERCHGQKLAIKTDYNGLGKMQYIIAEKDIPVLDTIYADNVEIITLVPEWEYEGFLKELTEATAGKGVWEELEEVDYVRIEKQVVIISD
ncbi:MAG: YigZ family protein [Lachnospiraceae bacterium]|jgi:uncharacterized YigZ family protein|nr:YigZ family protein [Lachnospiraceae bacterium]MBQ5559409.1 YigZ family protein [Lachnospiraceae bacterium]MCR4801561.1 YigZ family protein [Lachnospiraceae bacterium]